MPRYRHLRKGADFDINRQSSLEPLHLDSHLSYGRRRTEVQSQRENRVGLVLRRGHGVGRRARDLKAFMTPDFCLGAVDWSGCVETAVGWRNMKSTLANRAVLPAIDKVED